MPPSLFLLSLGSWKVKMLSSLQGCNGFLQRANSVQLLHQRNCNMVDEYGKSTRKNKSKDAALTHAMAERKRRERINAHLHTLKKLFPHLPKVCSLPLLSLLCI